MMLSTSQKMLSRKILPQSELNFPVYSGQTSFPNSRHMIIFIASINNQCIYIYIYVYILKIELINL